MEAAKHREVRARNNLTPVSRTIPVNVIDQQRACHVLIHLEAVFTDCTPYRLMEHSFI